MRGSIARDRHNELLCLFNNYKYKHNFISYVGYTSNLKKDLFNIILQGAKFTRGRVWKLIYVKDI